jgi:hypothetical protein
MSATDSCKLRGQRCLASACLCCMQPLKSRLSCRAAPCRAVLCCAVPRRFDGVGGIEQCPILPGKRMTIRFRVNEMPGTYQVRYRASKTLTVGNSAEPDRVLFCL